jgi:alpha-tubulin suppressor-like RCC1 family protein
VVAVGDNYWGQCNVADWTRIARIAAGYDYTIGLTPYDTVIAVGDNSYGQCNVAGWYLS